MLHWARWRNKRTRDSDAQKTDRHYEEKDLAQLYKFANIEAKIVAPPSAVPNDELLAKLLAKHGDIIYKFHTHESLVQENDDEQLTQREKEFAFQEFEDQKKNEKKMNLQTQFACLQIQNGIRFTV